MTIKSKLCAAMRGVVDSTGGVVHPQTFILEELLEDDELARQGRTPTAPTHIDAVHPTSDPPLRQW